MDAPILMTTIERPPAFASSLHGTSTRCGKSVTGQLGVLSLDTKSAARLFSAGYKTVAVCSSSTVSEGTQPMVQYQA